MVFSLIRTEHLFLHVQLENPPKQTSFGFVTHHMSRFTGQGVARQAFEMSA